MLNRMAVTVLSLMALSATVQAETQEPVLALMSDSHVVEIDRPPADVWALIKRMYHAGERYRARGLDIIPITDDPAAFLGGYRGVPKEGSGAPELVVHFSAVDDDNMFLAMFMGGLLPRGLYITHDVSPCGDGSRYQVVIQGYMPVDLPDGQAPTVEAVNDWMTARVAAHNAGLQEIVAKEIVEALK
jgi:hypothetical protein